MSVDADDMLAELVEGQDADEVFAATPTVAATKIRAYNQEWLVTVTRTREGV